MRVTMLVRCLAMMRGGGETRHVAWARELTSLGVRVDIIAGRPMLLGGPRYPIDGRLDVALLRTPYARDFVYRHQLRRGFGRLTMTALHLDEEWFCRAAWRRIAAMPEPPDVVHAHALHQTARLRRGNIPVVINLPGEPNRRYVRDLAAADAVVADGWAADELPRVLGRPVARVSKGVDAQQFRPDGRTLRAELRLDRKRVVIAVSRLVPIKNLALLLDAVAIVRERVPDIHVLLVGDGPERDRLRERAGALGLSDAVTFAGSVRQPDTAAFYRTADVFALTSDFDNSPNAVLEAMASGLPVVATDAGGARNFVDVPGGGALVARGDAEAFARALEPWLMDGDRRARAGAHNRARAATAFSWRASAEQLLDVYRRVVA